MADTPKVYVLCDANCKWEGMTKEQILTAITQAVNEGTVGDCDTGFVQTIKTINGQPLKFFVGEQSEYEALTDLDKDNLFAIITNDATKDGIMRAIADLEQGFSDVQNNLNAFKNEIESGYIVVGKANALSNGWIDGNNKKEIYGINGGLYVVVVDVAISDTNTHKFFTSVILCDTDNADDDSIGTTAIDESHTVRVRYSYGLRKIWAQVLNTSGGGISIDTHTISKYKKIL